MSIIKGKEHLVNKHVHETTSFHRGFGAGEEYFFSIDHQQRYHSDVYLENDWVAVTEVGITPDEFRLRESLHPSTEIENPDPAFAIVPEYEVTLS